MTREERCKKYIEAHCINCKNKNTDLCNIKIFVLNKIIYTKCCCFEKEK